MSEVLALSIGVGLVVGLLFTEFFGISSGGLVVPGYIALFLDRPIDIIVTFLVAFLAFSIVRVMSLFLIVYGKRRTALMILVGYLLGMLLKENSSFFANVDASLSIIGFIIPGLIATWMDRQGTVQTIASTLTIAIIVKLIIIMIGIEVAP